MKKGATVETWNGSHGTVIGVVGSKINVQFPDGRRFCSLGDIVSFKDPDDKFVRAKKRLAEFHNTPVTKTEVKPLEVKPNKVAMKLLTQEILNKIPPLRSQEDKGDDAIAYVKFFTPSSNWTWYATEYDPMNREFFGLVQGFEEELGYFSLDELENVKGPMGLGVERDMYFTPTPLKDLKGKTASIDKMAPGKVDEPLWDEAKQAIKKSTGKSVESFGDSEWAQVNKVYQNMGGKFKSKSSLKVANYQLNVISPEEDKENYIKVVTEQYNKRFKSQEQFEQQIDTISMDIAAELGAKYDRKGDTLVFDFSGALKDPMEVLEKQPKSSMDKAMSIMSEGLKSEGVYTPELIQKVESLIKEKTMKTAGNYNTGDIVQDADKPEKGTEKVLEVRDNGSIVIRWGDEGSGLRQVIIPSLLSKMKLNKVGGMKIAGHPNESFKAKYALGDTFVPSDGSDDSNQIRIVGMTENSYVVEQRPIGDRKPDKDDKTYGVRFEMKFSEIEGNKELRKFAKRVEAKSELCPGCGKVLSADELNPDEGGTMECSDCGRYFYRDERGLLKPPKFKNESKASKKTTHVTNGLQVLPAQADSDAISALDTAIEKAGIEYYGIDANLEISLGEYAVFFPKKGIVAIGNEGQGGIVVSYSAQQCLSDLEEASDGYFEFIDSTKQKEIDALDNATVAMSAYSLQQYSGTLDQTGEDTVIGVVEYAKAVARALDLELNLGIESSKKSDLDTTSVERLSSKLEKLSEEQKPNAETPTGNKFGKLFEDVAVNIGQATELWDKINKAGAGLTFETGVSDENKKALDADLQKLIDTLNVVVSSSKDLKETISPTPEPKTESLKTASDEGYWQVYSYEIMGGEVNNIYKTPFTVSVDKDTPVEEILDNLLEQEFLSKKGRENAVVDTNTSDQDTHYFDNKTTGMPLFEMRWVPEGTNPVASLKTVSTLKPKTESLKTAGTELWATEGNSFWLLSTVTMEPVSKMFDTKEQAVDYGIKEGRWDPSIRDRLLSEDVDGVGSPEDLKMASKSTRQKIASLMKKAERLGEYEFDVHGGENWTIEAGEDGKKKIVRRHV